MTSLRSSVHPKPLNQPWGTILKPEFGLGHQKMTSYEIDQTVNRLYYVTKPKDDSKFYPPQEPKTISEEDMEALTERLTKVDKEKIPDSDRRMKTSIYKDMGVVSSFAWKGYN